MDDINIYENRLCSCYERSLATICSKEDNHFEMMFLDAWDFNLNKKEHIHIMGDALSVNGWNIEKYIEEYHGIKLKKVPVTWFDAHHEDILLQEIQEKKLVIINEEFLLYDIDTSSNYKLYSMRSNQFVLYPKEHFKSICSKITMYTYNPKHTILSYNQIATHTKHRISSVNGENTMFDKMNTFAEMFYFMFDPAKEFDRIMEYDQCRLIEFLIEISRGRTLFALNMDTQFSVQKELNSLLIMAEAKWSSIMALFVKAFYTKEMTSTIKNKIYKNIKEAITIEKKAFSTLCNSVN